MDGLELEGELPEPGVSSIAVADNGDGTIVGLLCLQPVLHMEPLVIAENYKGKVNYRSLVALLEEKLKSMLNGQAVPYHVFTPDAKIAKMAKLVGMKQLPYRIWSKMIGG